MEARFTNLASGSSGNASLLEVKGFGLLIDCGLHPKTLTARLAAIGSSWNAIHAVVLTHTHGDHWKDTTLARLRSLRIPLFAHEHHLTQLNTSGPSFESLHRAKLTRTFAEGQSFAFDRGLTCRPFAVPHDSDPTFAFRFDHHDDSGSEPAWAVGYASDLGWAPEPLADAFAGVDVLAVEYNHDEHLQRTSARPAHLIRRVLGEHGHLSNKQGAAFTSQVLARSGEDYPSCLVQLHLSRECNTPSLALQAGRDALAAFRRHVAVVTTRQDLPSRSLTLERKPATSTRLTRSTLLPPAFPVVPHFLKRVQPLLPGFET